VPYVLGAAKLPNVELELITVPFSVEVEAADGPCGLGDDVVENAP